MAVATWFFLAPPASALHVDRLDPAEIDTLHAVMASLEPYVTAKQKAGEAALLTWEELYAPLTLTQQAFLDQFRELRGATLGATSHYFGEAGAGAELVPVGRQEILKDGLATPLDPQYLPRRALDAYHRMMDAIEADLGTRLLVESGYRSAAYQLYLFLYYMPNHDLSITETNRFVALPGHSEHGHPARQAIDFINEAGINGEEHPEEFEALPEYRWLESRAHEFGFALSYPRDNAHNTAFEPWHWHFEGQ